MKPETVKRITRFVVPLLLALGAAYGYVDNSCTCGATTEETAP